ncbi:[FeFe] hydrogenase H-cluster radical SAM maturase HydE [Peptoniphilus equinus]|uniref:[FeFe] hydrogenase H-cluster radical SAM maturase HydE n=1 Tax=Peptoniphilus equinus TaxID=3016343 RepID=A0ABY7QQZ5_9FIRM|nr:[FeFe] hydrogenase H-cluster radical SAM maturase HydE [Peptoniphilus equinus]WBW49222.1 [FeFe] hydrogenase H-cluster radical SAM maturase HydE [Peptoniphilus equinus]
MYKSDIKQLADELIKTRRLSGEKFEQLLTHRDVVKKEIQQSAKAVTTKSFHRTLYVRGLIEISNYCRNNCFYCGIRRDNDYVSRYRLTKDEILKSVRLGTDMGFKTFVLQGGEDPGLSDAFLMDVLDSIHHINPEAAITLSIGEKDTATLEAYKSHGADRFLLRHETKNRDHYYQLHPETMSLENRLRALSDLKALGYQTGSGIMVGTPGQTYATLAEDLVYLHELQPEMVGIGPFIPAKHTPFENEPAGSVELTLFLLCVLRLMFPKANIPATTSLNTLSKTGRDDAITYACNVYMPNLTPPRHRKDYALYDDKACFKIEAAENLDDLKAIMKGLGREVVMDRGDFHV